MNTLQANKHTHRFRHSIIAVALALGISPAVSAKPVSITVLDTMDFGILTPSNGTCSLASNAKLTGTGGQTCTGSGQTASFRISGDKNASVFIMLSGSSTGGVTLNPILDASPSQVLNGGKATVKVIGELILNNPTISGNLGLSYTISANYE